jgi:hypothetical protein
MMDSGITKMGKGFLRWAGEDEEKPVGDGDEAGASVGEIEELGSGDESERLCRGGRGEFIF